MDDFYLCFKTGAVSFLIPLEQVVHIFTAQTAAEPMEYEGKPVRIHRTREWLDGRRSEENHAVLLRAAGEFHALLAEQAAGVEQIPAAAFLTLPPEVRSGKNRFLDKAAKLSGSGEWAYLLELRELIREESRDDENV